MDRITRAAIEFERTKASAQQWQGDDIGAPQLAHNMRESFLAGAAAMAELCNESTTEELRQIRALMSEVLSRKSVYL